jgi:hypothetical protein
MRGKRKKSHVQDQVSVEGVAKLTPFALEVPLGQSYVHRRCLVATANSLFSKDQVAYGELNRVNGQGSLRSRYCLQLHLLGRIPCEQFHVIMALPCFVSSYYPVGKGRIIISTTDEVAKNHHVLIMLALRQDS